MPQSSEVAVEFRDVSFQINDRDILSHLNLTIYQGETIVLLGRSGSGKTTTLKLILMLLDRLQQVDFITPSLNDSIAIDLS